MAQWLVFKYTVDDSESSPPSRFMVVMWVVSVLWIEQLAAMFKLGWVACQWGTAYYRSRCRSLGVEKFSLLWVIAVCDVTLVFTAPTVDREENLRCMVHLEDGIEFLGRQI